MRGSRGLAAAPTTAPHMRHASQPQPSRPAARPPHTPHAYNEMEGGPASTAKPEVVTLAGASAGGLPLGTLCLPLPGLPDADALTLICPLDVDAVLDHYIDAGEGDTDPYWARPWPAGAALAASLITDPRRVAGLSVVDMGAGLGVAGLGAARAGAAAVLVTDRDDLALQCAAASARACGLPPGIVTTATLDWGDAHALTAAAADVVLAADVLYEAGAAEPVARALTRLVMPGGVALVADPAMRAPAIRAAFAAALGDRLVLESWRAVDGDSGAPTTAMAKGAILLLTLVAPVGGHTLRVEWP